MCEITNEVTFGYVSGSFGNNTLSYITLEPIDKSTVQFTITIPPEKESGKPIVLGSMSTNKTIVIDQKNCDPYPTMAINIDGINIHSKKYLYILFFTIIKSPYYAYFMIILIMENKNKT